MLFDKLATLYTVTRNANMVASWGTGSTFLCNIQPMGSNPGFGGSPVYNQYKMFTETMTIKEGDKVTYGTDVYIVKDVDDRKGVLRQYLSVIMEKSRGN